VTIKIVAIDDFTMGTKNIEVGKGRAGFSRIDSLDPQENLQQPRTAVHCA